MHETERRERLRATFTEDAELYDRMRPGYPSALFDDLASIAQLEPGARVLEIGCGTGQATRPLAERGYRVTAIDLGSDMAAVARRNLAAFAEVDVLHGAFEPWPLPDQPFDVVLSATAFHWLDPAVRLPKLAAALRTGGTLALISTEHVAGGDISFFNEAQRCYERWDPSTAPGVRLQPADNIPVDTAELDGSSLFDAAVVRRYEWTRSYTSRQCCDLLLTYSGHRALDPMRQQHLLECITSLIERRFAGRITKQYMNQLTLSRRNKEKETE